MMENIVLIPMRGGSKSIPKKNIKMIAGKPLCYWAIRSALSANSVKTVYVSTDSQEIAKTVENLFPNKINKNLIIEMRSPKLAKDTSSTEDVINDFIKGKDFKNFGLIQVTSPLITSVDIDNTFMALNGDYQSALSAVRIKRFFWNEDGTAQNYDPLNRPRRQDFNGSLVENGAIYATTKDSLINSKCRISGRTAIIEMHEDSFQEIDEPSDFDIVEGLLRKNIFNKELNIRAVVFDVDGTLTDGGMYYSERGESLKKFNTSDFKGIELLREAGIKTCIITAEDSESVHRRIEKVNFPKDSYFYGIKNKLPTLEMWATKNNINLSSIAYLGDDLGDLECMKKVGFSCCPRNAATQIKSTSNYISNKSGGDGFAREVIEYILISNENN
jgi:YrbI family 3-deoxy-D-manno-octulosonate 8-phosphate phosphatase